ncbi:MAG: hypothetical protein WD426_17880 [Anditalea sp.]
MNEDRKKKNNPEDEKNILEWAVFSLSLLLITGILGYLVFQTIQHEPGSPDLVITYETAPSPHAPYRYHVTISNEGQETAEEVQIELILEKDGQQLELATLDILYAPKESSKEGWVNFSKNPIEADTLYARVVSYKKP